jgi:hypothetical protein
MMEWLIVGLVLAYSVYRTWQNPMFGFVAGFFMHVLDYWLRLRVPFFYANKNVLNAFLAALIIFAAVHHCVLSRNKAWRKLSVVEVLLILIIGYSWLSLLWSPGREAVLSYSSGFYVSTFVNQLISLILFPMLLKVSLDRYDFNRDMMLVGLTILPLVALTVEFEDRGATHLFLAFDAATGEIAASSVNPLLLSYFGSVLAMFAVIFWERTLKSTIMCGAVFVISLYLMLESQSRGQLIATVVILLVATPMLHAKLKPRQFLIFGPPILLIAGLVALNIGSIMMGLLGALGYDEAVQQRYDTSNMSADFEARIWFIRDVTNVWKTSIVNFLFGLGTAASFAIVGMYPHNVPIEVFLEQGSIIGIAYIAAMILTLVAISSGLSVAGLEPRERQMLLFCGAQFAALLIIALKQGALYTSFDILTMAAFCAVLSDHYRRKYRRAAVQASAST